MSDYHILMYSNGVHAGVTDSSGMRFYYSDTSREHDAGIIFLGHDVTSLMVVPPGASNYTIGGVCTANCTKSVCKFVFYNYDMIIILCDRIIINTTINMHVHSTFQMVVSESLPTFCTLILLVSVFKDHNYKLSNSLDLHAHTLTGRALELQHLRWNTECGVYEELPPIDLNPNYDFNFQQHTHLPMEITVLPVSTSTDQTLNPITTLTNSKLSY